MNILEKFMRECLERGMYQKRSVLEKSMDYIDASQLPKKVSSDKITEQNRFFTLIPPFKKAMIKSQDKVFFSYEVNSMDIDDRIIDLNLDVYAYIEYEGNSKIWSQIGSGRVCVKFKDIGEGDEVMIKKQYDLITEVDPSTFGWSKPELDGWKRCLNRMKGELSEDALISAYASAITQFFKLVQSINLYLLENGPKKAGKAPKSKVKTKVNIEEQPERILRKIGHSLQVKSESIPRVYNANKTREYKMASWKTRGHYRTYKSGKVVYVKESVHTRKGLSNNNVNIEPPKTTLKLN